MKVRVAYTVDIDDSFRREIREYYGRPGLASRAEIKAWFKVFGRSMDYYARAIIVE